MISSPRLRRWRPHRPGWESRPPAATRPAPHSPMPARRAPALPPAGPRQSDRESPSSRLERGLLAAMARQYLDDRRRRLLDRPPGDVDDRPAVLGAKPPRRHDLLPHDLRIDIVGGLG